jgi:hypothetical protein
MKDPSADCVRVVWQSKRDANPRAQQVLHCPLHIIVIDKRKASIAGGNTGICKRKRAIFCLQLHLGHVNIRYDRWSIEVHRDAPIKRVQINMINSDCDI